MYVMITSDFKKKNFKHFLIIIVVGVTNFTKLQSLLI